jgi:hypothetical protein
LPGSRPRGSLLQNRAQESNLCLYRTSTGAAESADQVGFGIAIAIGFAIEKIFDGRPDHNLTLIHGAEPAWIPTAIPMPRPIRSLASTLPQP